MGREAVFHQQFAGNCYETPSDKCLSAGIGPKAYDCSGLAIASICDVLGKPVGSWPAGMRHVREIWHVASQATTEPIFTQTGYEEGALLIFRRVYDVHGYKEVVAGHLAIASLIQGDAVTYLHANSNMGTVEERELRSPHSVLGSVLVNQAQISTYLP